MHVCRLSGNPLSHVFVDLGTSPLANSYLRAEDLGKMEPSYPLKVYACEKCLLVQLPVATQPETIFNHYAYFSSYTTSWLRHAEAYAEGMTAALGLGPGHKVIELGSNDGYLLQYFVGRGIPVLGVEPAANVAAAAVQKGIPTLVKFFSVETARSMVKQGHTADLLLGNNVLAHVPDLNDFIFGMKLILKPRGVITMEFPHLMRLMEENQFDTIYHEHLSYFSFLAVERAFARHDITLFDVEQLPTHGGSLRIYGRHAEDTSRPVTERVASLRDIELSKGFDNMTTYEGFVARVEAVKRDLLEFLISVKRAGKSVAGYGAPAKGNTLLNYCGIGTGLLDYTVDRSPHKQGLFLPGTHIPIHAPERIAKTKPDYVLILPWNIKDEIIEQMAHVRQWGGKFVVAIPRLEVIE